MKKGKTLIEMATELERQINSRADYLADTRNLTLSINGSEKLEIENTGEFTPTDHTHAQISDRLSIPKRFYDRLRANHPGLLQYNVNTLFRKEPEKRMIRTMDGKARAFLSDRYRRLDNYEILETALPVLQEDPSLQIMSAEITDKRMYLKVVSPKVEGEVKVGEPVQGGLVIQNSEIGMGALAVHPLIYTLSCSNGMIAQKSGMRKYHIGKANGGDAGVEALLTDETRAADDKAFMLKVRDIIRAAMDQTSFQTILDTLKEAATNPIEDPVKVVEKLSEKYALTQDEHTGIFKNLIEDGGSKGLTRYGLLSAVTRYSQTVESYDRATELETLGGKILDLAPSEWKVINAA